MFNTITIKGQEKLRVDLNNGVMDRYQLKSLQEYLRIRLGVTDNGFSYTPVVVYNPLEFLKRAEDPAALLITNETIEVYTHMVLKQRITEIAIIANISLQDTIRVMLADPFESQRTQLVRIYHELLDNMEKLWKNIVCTSYFKYYIQIAQKPNPRFQLLTSKQEQNVTR